MHEGGRDLSRDLERERTTPEVAMDQLAEAVRTAPTIAARVEAYRVLGAIAGRAFRASAEIAERAAFVLLAAARDADAPAERAALSTAMGRAFRNAWLMPYVHSRLSDDDAGVVAAAIGAAGGLAFPALEEAIASRFLDAEAPSALRLAAIGALGRMGAESAAPRLVPFVLGDAILAAAALSALTEIRSRAGEEAALEVLGRDPPREVLVAAARYLAELGREEVLATLRTLAREEDAELRIAAGLASRAFKAERARDADERILSALTERDRAVRAALARRLRTLPVADVLAHAEILLSDDAEGVVEVVAEIRAPEVTRLLLRLASDPSIDASVRALAAGSIEANEAWERDALAELIASSGDLAVRVAATRTLGAFASLELVVDGLGKLADDPAPAMRAAWLWALQLAARPGLAGAERLRAEERLRKALGDADPLVRRRAAYVAGNLDAAALVPELVTLARDEPERPEIRVAAFVALADLGAPAKMPDLVFLWNKENDPDALGAVSRAIERALTAPEAGHDASPPASLARVRDRLPKLLASADARVRGAAARVAGLTPGSVPLEALVALLDDPAPRVRAAAVTAIGRAHGAAAESALARALGDGDAAVQERAAEALLATGSVAATTRVVEFVSRTADRAAASRLVDAITLPPGDPAPLLDALRAALARTNADDPAYEPLLALQVAALEATRPAPSSRPSVDASIAALFPTWPRLAAARGFEPLGKSLRTAEMLFASTNTGEDADLSAAIVLWMKCLEGYLHAWLGPRLRGLQQQPSALWELTDRVVGGTWPAYQRYLGERWPDPVVVGGLSVEVPLRSVVNALREFQERRVKSVDSPASVTDWSRLLLFFGLDHPSGPKNLFKIACRDGERAVRLAHRLHVLAQVRNAVTHRTVAGPSTLAEFRRAYYAAFEDLTGVA